MKKIVFILCIFLDWSSFAYSEQLIHVGTERRAITAESSTGAFRTSAVSADTRGRKQAFKPTRLVLHSMHRVEANRMLEIESLREFVLVPRDDSMDSPRSTLVKQVSATHIELHSKNLSRIVVIEALTSEPIYFHPVIGAESSNFALTPNSVRVHPVPRRGVVITESDW